MTTFATCSTNVFPSPVTKWPQSDLLVTRYEVPVHLVENQYGVLELRVVVKADSAEQSVERVQRFLAEATVDAILESQVLEQKCIHCGHQAKIGPVRVDGTGALYGSAADFCTACDRPWETESVDCWDHCGTRMGV